jgi:chemotaxis receptor (MCP) glutamine deamidase CheD
MFPDHFRAGAMNVGQRNGEAALALLNHHGVPIVSESLFGLGHRQIIFDVRNGEAALALLNHHGVPIVSESLFGLGHRQIIFDVRNGDVWCHQVAPGSAGQEPEGDLV